MECMKITKDNDFTLIVEAYNKEGLTETPQDLRLVDDFSVSIPGAPDGSYTYRVDDGGRLVFEFDGPKLSVRPYGLKAKGTIGGKDWCLRIKRLFEIVKYTDESNTHERVKVNVNCALPGTNWMPVKAVTMEQMANMELAPSTLYIVVDET